MNKYELILIVDSQLTEEQKDDIQNQALDGISKSKGKVINAQRWLDKHKMAFKIKNVSEATYYLIRFDSGAENVQKLKEFLRVNENILRFAIYRSQETSVKKI